MSIGANIAKRSHIAKEDRQTQFTHHKHTGSLRTKSNSIGTGTGLSGGIISSILPISSSRTINSENYPVFSAKEIAFTSFS